MRKSIKVIGYSGLAEKRRNEGSKLDNRTNLFEKMWHKRYINEGIQVIIMELWKENSYAVIIAYGENEGSNYAQEDKHFWRFTGRQR